MTALVFGLFGLIVGSFLNVLILRHGTLPLSGRSVCSTCKKKIPVFDLVPVVSWLLLRGRCRMCKAAISIQYPLVEALVAMTFALIGAAPLPLLIRILALPLAALLIAITVYDFHHTIIPDAWVYPFAGLSLTVSFIGLYDAPGSIVELVAAGPIVAAPLFFLWLYSRGTWMGLGDAKLALGIGWLLGLSGGFTTLFSAFVLGALVSVLLLFFSSRVWKRIGVRFIQHVPLVDRGTAFTMKSEIPFGPFLVASCFIIWFTQMYGIPITILLL